LGNGPIWVPIFVVLPKHSQILDHSMIVRNYVFYSLNQFKSFQEKVSIICHPLKPTISTGS
jgi:hypothetical protein